MLCTQKNDDQQRQQHAGEGRKHIENPADRLIREAVSQPGKQAKHDTARDADQHGADADQQRTARPENHARQHVPS
jgi:hypothetical protein